MDFANETERGLLLAEEATLEPINKRFKTTAVPEVRTLRARTEEEVKLLRLIGAQVAVNEEENQLEAEEGKEVYEEEAGEDDENDDEDEDDEDDEGEGGEKRKEPTPAQRKKLVRFAKFVLKGIGGLLLTIEVPSITPAPCNVSWDSDPEFLCCYNWLEAYDGTSTIFVPGQPPKWTPRAVPYTVKRDTGFQYLDYNYARAPVDPYAPMFHALGVMKPNYQFMDVDVLADRNNLRVLLEFVKGQSNGPWRLNLFMNYNTLIIVRKEERYWRSTRQVQYGHTFERDFTSPGEGLNHATNHYRAIRYAMGPLNLVVRYEADAFLDSASDTLMPAEANAASGGLVDGDAVDRLPSGRPRFNYLAPIKTVLRGHIIPSAQIVELKTQAEKLNGQGSVYCQDQLWFGRTTHLFTARYEKETGTIKKVKYEDTRSRVAAWEAKNQEALRKLVTLLSEIKNRLRQEPGPFRCAALVRSESNGPLQLCSVDRKGPASKREFFERHWKPERRRGAAQSGGHRGARGHPTHSRGGLRTNQSNHGPSNYRQPAHGRPSPRQSENDRSRHDLTRVEPSDNPRSFPASRGSPNYGRGRYRNARH